MDPINPASPSPEPVNPVSAPAASSVPPPPAPPAATAPAKRTNITGSDKLWAILSHISCLFGIWFIIPIVVYLVMRDESDYVAENAKEALNFHISLLIYALCSLLLVFMLVGIPLLVVLGLCALVLSIVAAVKASDGIIYRYPLTIRLVH